MEAVNVMRENKSCKEFRQKNYPEPINPIVAFAEEFLREREEQQKAETESLPNEFFEEVFGWKDGEPLVESDSSDSSDSSGSQKPSKQDQTRKANKAQKNKKKAAEDFAREVSEKAKIVQQQEREKALKKKIQKQKKLKQQKEMDSLPALIPIAEFNLIKEVELELEIEGIETIVYKPFVAEIDSEEDNIVVCCNCGDKFEDFLNSPMCDECYENLGDDKDSRMCKYMGEVFGI
jgi:flagellar biosynthesis GTPase FlhF